MRNRLSSWLAILFPEVTAKEFYRYIFPAGELDTKGALTKGKYTGVVCRIAADKKQWDGKRQRYKTKVYRYTLTDELDAIDEATQSDDFCICRPLSYVGKQATAEHARMMYALAVDVDRLIDGRYEPTGLINLWERHIQKVKRIPKPTFIVSSGTGLHLYYVLEKPVALFPDVAYELQEYKRELTRLIWHDTIVNINSVFDIQQEGIYQGFRMPGTITKNGDRVRAFQTGERVTLDYLNSFVSDSYKAKRAAERQKWKKTHTSLTEAAAKYPDWYERRIVRGEPRGAWAVNRRLYDWWKEKILQGATVGHRYYCCMMLAVYARKCGQYDAKHNPTPVTQEELERDCFNLLEHMEGLTREEDNHFGVDDIQDALEAYEDRWVTYPRAAIEYRTGITIPANKRNGQKQEEHLEEARAIRDIRAQRRGEAWDAHNGRKSKLETVQEWRREHPTGCKADCVRGTGLSKPTVYKHWSAEEAEAQAAAVAERKQAAAEARQLEELGQEARRLSLTIKEQIAAGEAVAQKMAERLEKMPEGAEKERYKAEYMEALEGLQGIKKMMLPE